MFALYSRARKRVPCHDRLIQFWFLLLICPMRRINYQVSLKQGYHRFVVPEILGQHASLLFICQLCILAFLAIIDSLTLFALWSFSWKFARSVFIISKRDLFCCDSILAFSKSRLKFSVPAKISSLSASTSLIFSRSFFVSFWQKWDRLASSPSTCLWISTSR